MRDAPELRGSGAFSLYGFSVIRTVAVVAGVVLGVLLGAVQLASSAAYGDLAVRPSLPAALHALAPGLLRPFIGNAQARTEAAVHDGDLATAERLAATLPNDADGTDIRGRIAEARGNRDAAIQLYVRAGDVVRAQALIDALSVTQPDRALGDEALLVAAHQDDANAGEVRGEAWWRLGQLQAAAGYRNPAQRTSYWRKAEASYERALALAPNEETYLLAAGFQSLANGDIAAASRWYAHAADVVPNSADAYAGLAWTAAASHDCARARDALTRSRALRGATTTAATRDPTDDPLVGPPLKRCAT
jgi:tetratricopeptide (TPR) repeat protein